MRGLGNGVATTMNWSANLFVSMTFLSYISLVTAAGSLPLPLLLPTLIVTGQERFGLMQGLACLPGYSCSSFYQRQRYFTQLTPKKYEAHTSIVCVGQINRGNPEPFAHAQSPRLTEHSTMLRKGIKAKSLYFIFLKHYMRFNCWHWARPAIVLPAPNRSVDCVSEAGVVYLPPPTSELLFFDKGQRKPRTPKKRTYQNRSRWGSTHAALARECARAQTSLLARPMLHKGQNK